MYNLPHFKEQDAAKVIGFVKEHPFALLCGVDAGNKPVATQVPVFIDERDGGLFLSGHMLKNSDHHQAFLHNADVLAVFTGAHSYISASWYENKQQVSTWNYRSVHAKGKLRFLDDQALLEVLRRTTDHFENDPHSPAGFDQLPPDYVQRLAKAIVAFEVEVAELDHVFKLSQNKDEKNYENIIGKLEQLDADGRKIAAAMKENKPRVFKH
ncbi:MAG: FMN-binding negative transcriptional regulator [Chitinophagaceae bacterium]